MKLGFIAPLLRAFEEHFPGRFLVIRPGSDEDTPAAILAACDDYRSTASHAGPGDLVLALPESYRQLDGGDDEPFLKERKGRLDAQRKNRELDKELEAAQKSAGAAGKPSKVEADLKARVAELEAQLADVAKAADADGQAEVELRNQVADAQENLAAAAAKVEQLEAVVADLENQRDALKDQLAAKEST